MEYPLPPNEVIVRLRTLLKEFCTKRIKLIEQDPHEDTIVDELRPYLIKYFGDFPYDTNHNYDLMHSNDELVKKKVNFLYDELPKSRIPKDANTDHDTVTKEILPDIIMHDLQSKDHNFLMIEIKKSSNKKKDARDMDILKLKAATTGALNYDFGCFINFKTGNDFDEQNCFEFQLFVNGEIIHSEANN